MRSQTRGERQDELVFVGMKAPKSYNESLEKEMQLAYKKRKQEQAYNKEAYEKDLIELKVRGDWVARCSDCTAHCPGRALRPPCDR